MTVMDELKAKTDETKQLAEEITELLEQLSRDDLSFEELLEIARKARKLKKRVKKL